MFELPLNHLRNNTSSDWNKEQPFMFLLHVPKRNISNGIDHCVFPAFLPTTQAYYSTPHAGNSWLHYETALLLVPFSLIHDLLCIHI